ncbi:N5-glutamine S-adenosyl-L-methionine-dependent methyltransferase [Alloiococcus otitis]|uniref:Methyltransferase domain-containing protein n=1 Tax=Alloiococcus otitis ATCC 51267 TaxID=883081 RepID=K9E812_9LACT|nr:tRNA1(Val) (adenine(37)-N6)-methyltransferase [Alloiococcus otitis]EKU93329.1 hypothetical protein HMPREF9698_01077 [Alloiococcus otitis ATCC 51267]SUU81546.1 N5-glutamine S-adenosyl-L-methionine-dependent methyltransferase [Alloiococcus otitis]
MASDNSLKAGERVDLLYPSRRQIIQSKKTFSYSVDAILLAHFAKLPKSRHAKLLDLCAGNGAVTLLLADQTSAKLVGVEIQEKLVDMARRSASLNGLSDQVDFLQADLVDYSQQVPAGSVDCLTCNPPYFQSSKTRQNKLAAYAQARHEVTLDLASLLEAVSRLLKNKGLAYLVYRTDRLVELIDQSLTYSLVPKQVQLVYPKFNRPSKFFLVKLIKQGSKAGFQLDPPFYIMDDKSKYTDQMIQVLKGNG